MRRFDVKGRILERFRTEYTFSMLDYNIRITADLNTSGYSSGGCFQAIP